MNLALKNVINARKPKLIRSKSGSLTFLLAIFLFLCLLISPVSAAVEWKILPSNPTVGDTMKIIGTASPREHFKLEISFEKKVPVSEGKYELLLKRIKIPKGNNNLFTVRADGVQNLNLNVKKYVWFKLQSNASNGIATISQANVPPFTYRILIKGDALSEKSSVNLTVTASQTLKADSKGRFSYTYSTSSMSEGEYSIKIGDSEKTIVLQPKNQKKACNAIPQFW